MFRNVLALSQRTAAASALSAATHSSRTAGASRSFAVLAEAPNPVTYSRKGPQPAVAPAAIKTVSKTASGVSIATYDHLGPASSLAVVVNAGSRFETADAPGIAHLLENVLIRTIPGDNVSRTIREAELRGNSLFSSVSREHIVLGSEFLRDDLVDAVPTLLSNFFNKSFHSYEFLDAVPRVVEQTAASLADPTTAVIEKLHQVAFRNGLGNSLFASEDALHALTRADLLSFAAKYFTADRITVVGSGVAHSDLKTLVDKALEGVDVASIGASGPKSQYFGGEARIEAGPHSTAHYAIAFPGAAVSSADYNASLVLRTLLDGSRRLKWGSRGGATGLLAGASTDHTSARAFNASYSDAGLFGIYVQGKGKEVKHVASKSLDALKALASNVSADALARAKKAAIVDAEDSLTRASLIDTVAKGTLSTGAFHAGSEVLAINQVTAADVQKLAERALSAKPSIVAYGNTLALPYADQL
ncbi:Metalloenzyme, LuxS/M16 peptidase-like protein [Entophlyctis helioformis]|nr:Metalloenzyme, LuxS/M16 peptidase-like protein [Entophlyctis helioformis]